MLFCVKTPINKLYVFGMALLLAVTLAGCGGNGGGTATTPPDPTPMECPAGTSGTYPNCMTPQEVCEAEGGEYRGDMCVSAEMLEEERMAAVAAATKAAGTKEMAIATEAAETGTNDGGLGGSTFDAGGNLTGAVATYTLTIDPADQTVEITDSALDGEDDPKFIQAMDLGGGTTMHARAMAADDDGNVVEEVVVVSTDIEDPTPTAFGMVHTLDVRVDGETATDNMPNDALQIVEGNIGMVKAGAFTAPSGTTGTTTLSFQQAVADDPSTTDTDESRDAAEIMGTFNGAMGTFKCNAAGASGCAVTVNAMGVVSAVSADNDWIFIPAEGATVDVGDGDFLHYGFWLKKTTAANGAITYNEVETFAGSSVDASGNVSTVLGQATYEGGATGVYVKNVYNPDRTINMATSGHFRADVRLMAIFGQVPVSATDATGTIAPNLLNTVSGTIDNFMLSGGEDNMWSVAVAGTIVPATGIASGTAKGGDGDGSFSATFHGSVAADTDGNIPQPGSVVGEFNAGFSDGVVAGGFGARKMME